MCYGICIRMYICMYCIYTYVDDMITPIASAIGFE